MLYRVFPFVPERPRNLEGGALFVPRERQGVGRHDNPDHYGAIYVSREPEAAIAERIQAFRGQELTDVDLGRPDGSRYALVELDDSALDPLVDLDDPHQLVDRSLRPSFVATRDWRATQPVALAIFEEGVPGFAWWSMLEASWTNVTLFAERASPSLRIAAQPEVVSVRQEVVRAAADVIGVRLR